MREKSELKEKVFKLEDEIDAKEQTAGAGNSEREKVIFLDQQPLVPVCVTYILPSELSVPAWLGNVDCDLFLF